ncbi:MAG: hypothetical protein NTX79_06070 [Candidatus Micrarchaeota archaeon]|nr:hypothetical protein [Candidatus Micrarchaeota archaeon]
MEYMEYSEDFAAHDASNDSLRAAHGGAVSVILPFFERKKWAYY